MGSAGGAAGKGGTGRIAFFDTLRGLTIVSMVAFHTCYDLAYLFGLPMAWFTEGVFQDVWRCSISWTFLFIAGWMTSFSRSNYKRAGVYALAALLVFVATSIAGVDATINFGIIFCMAACTLIYALCEPAFKRASPLPLLIAFLVLFAITYEVPQTRYAFEGFAWLGFPSESFSSGDYYPIIPFVFMYLAGAMAAQLFNKKRPQGYPAWMQRDWCPPLTFLGRHSLIIYLLHQPIVLVVLMLVFSI